MNNVLTVVADSNIDNNLVGLWDAFSLWSNYLKSIDPNIIDVEISLDGNISIITFKSEEHKTWFILRWS